MRHLVLRTASVALTVLLVAACSSGGHDASDTATPQRVPDREAAPTGYVAGSVLIARPVDTQGGSARLDGIVEVTVPPGAISNSGTLQISLGENPNTPNPAIKIDLIGAGIVAPIELRFAVADPTHAPDIVNYWNGTSWASEPVTFDEANNVAIATVDHLSWWNPVSWCWTCIADKLWQASGQLIGSRGTAPTCTTAPPAWVTELITNPSASAPILACVESNDGRAVIRATNNRGYWQVLRSSAGLSWGWSRFRELPVNDWAHELASDVFREDEADFILLPPLTEVTIGLDRPQSGFVRLSGGATLATSLLTILLEAASKVASSELVQTTLIRFVFACLPPTTPNTDSPEAAATATDILKCVGDTISNKRAVLSNNTPSGLSDEEFASLMSLKKFLKALDAVRISATAFDFVVDSSSLATIGLKTQLPSAPDATGTSQQTPAPRPSSPSAMAPSSPTAPPTAAPLPNSVPPRPNTTQRRTWHAQQGRHGADTFTNYINASGMGPKIPANSWVEVLCKVLPQSTIASAYPDGYWYRIASPPWNGNYFAVANTFWNGDTPSTPQSQWHNVDYAIPDC